MEWRFASAEALTVALRAGEVTSVELTDEAINAICVPDFDRARAAARRAEEARAGPRTVAWSAVSVRRAVVGPVAVA